MPPPDLPSSGTRIKRVITRWITLLIMEDAECSLTFVKVANQNIIMAAAKPPCFTHPPNLSKYTAD